MRLLAAVCASLALAGASPSRAATVTAASRPDFALISRYDGMAAFSPEMVKLNEPWLEVLQDLTGTGLGEVADLGRSGRFLDPAGEYYAPELFGPLISELQAEGGSFLFDRLKSLKKIRAGGNLTEQQTEALERFAALRRRAAEKSAQALAGIPGEEARSLRDFIRDSGLYPPRGSRTTGFVDTALAPAARTFAARPAAASLSPAREEDSPLIAESPGMRAALRDARDFGAKDEKALILGETGVGKELIARTLHESGPRRERKFVAINAAAMPAGLLADELFGHVKGAFTDAAAMRGGLVAQAEGGTLFLDEIGEIPLEMQWNLLDLVENGEYLPVGDAQRVQKVKADVRIIAATNQDLWDMVQKKKFLPELYWRLAQREIRVPPLRERREDIPVMAREFLAHTAGRWSAKDPGRPPAGKRFSREALDVLTAYRWPGNVRELQGAVQHALIAAQQEEIGARDLPEAIRRAAGIPEPPPSTGKRDLRPSMISLPSGGIWVAASRLSYELYDWILRAAHRPVSILIQGPSGSGKSLAARTVHEHSGRSEQPYLTRRLAGLSEELMESELFGHKKNAFTGASADKDGLFKTVGSGTLVLDSVEYLTPRMQAKLLRVLQERSFRPLGDDAAVIPFSARILALSGTDLAQEVRQGRFREDLYHRLNGITLNVAPLKDRSEDLPGLISNILSKLTGRPSLEAVSAEAMAVLAGYDWPGNILQLENALREALHAAGPSAAIEPEHLPQRVRTPPPAVRASEPEDFFIANYGKMTLREAERAHLTLIVGRMGPGHRSIGRAAGRAGSSIAHLLKQYQIRVPEAPSGAPLPDDGSWSLDVMEDALLRRALEVNFWNKTKVAGFLGIERSTLDRKIRKYGIKRDAPEGPK